ncbi:adenylate cyclase type 2-like isoform X1 [Leguminivora glycinivorella]|uniref:adenylate cyclase type 2-like isoform X1 n=2 Tax=Leguminivora glycinivorella TaxID=1035111 RepID=UPI00200E4802|nr:adenylate cyclase type 2-like isoform X1 [Leguminivora glycinivorella]
MGESSMSRTTGSVVLQVGALELLARYSMNNGRATSVLSSLHEFRVQEAEQVGGKQWNWKYLRDQFDQKDLEGLYRKYDDKLRESLIYIYISLLVFFSTTHIGLVIISTYSEQVLWKSTYLSFAMYILRIAVPMLFLCKCFYNPLKQKWFWIPIFVTFVITLDLVFSDIAVPLFSHYEGMSLRPAYSTMALLSIYIFLPMRNNFLAIFLGVLVSVIYVLIFAFVTYIEDPRIEVVVASDTLYLIGVNLMGVYFRLMNEIVTRRSFLDRRACVESTLRLKFVKDQEERLMLSIIPEHIVSRVRQDIRAMFLGIQSHTLSYAMRSFNQLYVEEHDNVSILYADVVNYTMISTTLSPMRMVELLNELFGRFDEASEEFDVLRIKFLGDCYYCVSGIPKPTTLHAKNCVDLGLDMIHIIKDVREKRSLNIDMRIGVHSGRILSGLIGMRKWQFDIWSKDATIANKMESTGKAGKVHVTKQTLELLIDYAREYIIEPNFESQNHPFILENKLETFLLSRPDRPITEYKPYRRASVGFSKMIKKRRSENKNQSNYRRTTTFMDENLVEYQQMLKAADAQMAKEIEDMTNGKEHFKKESKLNRFTLMFENYQLEKTFLLLPDPLFKYYITCCLIISLLIAFINALTTDWYCCFLWYTFVAVLFLIVGLVIMQPLTWFQFFWHKYKGLEQPRNRFLRRIYDISESITRSAKLRTAIYLLISISLAATSMVSVIECIEVKTDDPDIQAVTVLSNCYSSWHVTQCWGLALLLNFLFSRVFFIFKWIVAGGMTIFYLWVVWEIKTSFFAEDATFNVGLDPRVSHTLSVVFITITLYFIDRTTEYRNRLDHLWQLQLTEEQQEAETMLKVNNMLLENILPAHVVQVYLDLNRSIDELYYEKYDNVAVMFASLTDYKLGIEENPDDKLMLSILDEVISDFDRLLLTGTSVYKVEKIKMAGWTYMAACGLDPNRRESIDSEFNHDRRQNTPYNRAIVITMVEFAAAMMMQLHNFNRGSFQCFEGLNLRIGISNGEVAAGVVGSIKPLYDIWGHAVNMASRMDSTGLTGKIQVTEETAMILEECGIVTMYRGETFVKGAGYIKTFFVPLDENYDLVKRDMCNYRNRHYSVRNITSSESDYDPDFPLYNNRLSGNSGRQMSVNSEKQSSVHSVGNCEALSMSEDLEDENDTEVLTGVTSSNSISDDFISMSSSAHSDTYEYIDSENEVMETRC